MQMRRLGYMLGVTCLSIWASTVQGSFEQQVIDHGSELFFPLNIKALKTGKMQIASQSLSRDAFRAVTLLSALDMHGSSSLMTQPEDFVLVTRSAFLFRGKVEDFMIPHLTSLPYLNATLDADGVAPVPHKEEGGPVTTVRIEKNFYKLIHTKSIARFGHVRFVGTQPRGVAMSEAHSKAAVAAMGVSAKMPAALVNYLVIGPEDTTSSMAGTGTYGAITHNAFYAMGDQDSGLLLNVSVKIVTFKHEPWYDQGVYYYMGLWPRIKTQAAGQQHVGTWECMLRTRRYLERKHSMRVSQAK